MQKASISIPVIGICAYGSGAGKTTLLTQLIPALQQKGMRVSVIKHAHHKFDIDHPGKDSYKIREAGAIQTLVSSSKRWALMTELQHPSDEPVALEVLLKQLDSSLADIVLVEGYRDANIPKIEVHRTSLNYPLLAENDDRIIAVASDMPLASIRKKPVTLDLNNPEEIAQFILQSFHLTNKTS